MPRQSCVVCSTEFECRYKKKTCGEDCFRDLMSEVNTTGRNTTTVICEECGSEYESYDPDRTRFCSVSCRRENDRSRVELVCEECGVTYERPLSVSSKSRFCSWDCLAAWRTRTFRGENHHSHKPEITIRCNYCEEGFLVKPGSAGRKYCSPECYQAWTKANTGPNHPLHTRESIDCLHCGKSYYEKPAKLDNYEMHFCSRECHGKWLSENQRGENHPRWNPNSSTPTFYQTPEWRRFRVRVLDRDGHACKTCGSDGNRLHVHHITPISKGGTKFDMANLITLCPSCHGREHANEGRTTPGGPNV